MWASVSWNTDLVVVLIQIEVQLLQTATARYVNILYLVLECCCNLPLSTLFVRVHEDGVNKISKH